jgi:hypothetical protein
MKRDNFDRKSGSYDVIMRLLQNVINTMRSCFLTNSTFEIVYIFLMILKNYKDAFYICLYVESL